MASPTTQIDSLASLEIALGELSSQFGGEAVWWRGHAKIDWALAPGGFRKRPSGLAYNPTSLFNNFKMRATGRLGHRKTPSSDIDWLFLSQHYGLPTTVLDWTENPLTALFFAVGDGAHEESDACLWALSPTKLNVEYADPANPGTSQRGLIDPDERPVQAIVMKTIGFKDEAIRNRIFPEVPEELGLPSLPQVIALASMEMDERIVAQTGRFTLHGSSSPLDCLNGKEEFLRKFTIPSLAKKKLRNMLNLMGIRRWTLFPDLQSLASELKDNDFISINPGAA